MRLLEVDNVLLEGWLLELATKKLKVSKDDDFGLPLATCADCVGAVEVVAMPPDKQAAYQGDVTNSKMRYTQQKPVRMRGFEPPRPARDTRT